MTGPAGLTPGRMRTALAAELDASTYEYDPPLIAAIVDAVVERGTVEPDQLAALASRTYLDRNGLDRGALAGVIARALGGSVPRPAASATVSIRGGDVTYNVKLSGQSNVGSLNVGSGTQIVAEAGGYRNALLAGWAALGEAGLRDEWDADAAAIVATAIAERDDVTVADVQATTAETVRREQPKQSRAKAFLEKVAAGGLGGALGTGIAAGGGEVIHLLPM